MKDIIEIVKSLEESGLLLKGVSETIQNESKEQKGVFLSILLGTLGASLLGNILEGKGVIAMSQGQGVNRAGERIAGAGYGNKKVRKTTIKKKILPHPLTNFEIQIYYQNLTRFNGVYSRENLPRIKDAAM